MLMRMIELTGPMFASCNNEDDDDDDGDAGRVTSLRRKNEMGTCPAQ